ncbi:type II CAAX endopeptidase family protein [Enterococcus faecalis]|uniref:CPBP family intramembrane glutamic endopeptidase n=1 Tax=Enterococcus faecalis TaxID=1351 RepID=UPI0003307430|nr:type II CAAX endopeptidase family protein [Enterococcus faecalis]EOJ55716.1 hypothetical protein WMM_02787 [Enterococcus faecalis EnGen0364]MRJ30643.1 CPBP family intramembrane metalloprotease [Enterococcus faecalis]
MLINKIFKGILLSVSGIMIYLVSQFSASIVTKTLELSFFIAYPALYILLSCVLVIALGNIFKLGDMGIRVSKVNICWLFFGIFLPLTLNGLTILLSSGRVQVNGITNGLLLILDAVFIGAIAPAVTEEIIFRGFLFTGIRKYFGTVIAFVLPSFLFAAIHLFNGALNLLDTILLLTAGTAVGLMFTMIRIVTGNLWAGIVVHMLWDLLVGGNGTSNTLITISPKLEAKAFVSYIIDSPSSFINGGGFGIDASAIGILIYILVTILLYLKVYKKSCADNSLQK